MLFHRRQILKWAGSAALLSGTPGWAFAAAAPVQKRLVVVMLRGAVDGLNVVVPYGDSNYAALRPTIALGGPGGDDGVLDLDGHFGLHPALAALLPLWQQQRLAFVQASGSPDPTRSHFDAQDFMESGTPGNKNTPDGWLNRLVGALAAPHGPTQAISVGATRPRILDGHQPTSNVALGPRANKPLAADRPAVADAFASLYNGSDALSESYREGRAARTELAGTMTPDSMAPDAMQREQIAANNGAPLPTGFPVVGGQLARMLNQDPHIQVVFADLGGWDTHVNQGNAKGQLANHLQPLGDGLAALVQGLGPQRLDDTVIVVMSEFGRTARENGNRGTDHGHGNAMWVLGGPTLGGKVHGEWPGLGSGSLHEDRDLAVTTDFRSVIGGVLERHMGLTDRQLAMVLPNTPAPMTGLFHA